MGDTHFLLRHAIVGAVFLVFAWIGWWVLDPDPAWKFFTERIATEGFAAISALVLAPLIGITIQGLHIVVLQLSRGEVFSDNGRILLKRRMKKALETCKAGTDIVSDTEWSRLEGAPADALFVWLYHRSAPVELIEWARRRRSYYYLGINLVLAVLGGLATGMLGPPVGAAPTCIKVLLAVVGGLFWCVGAVTAALAMRDDVERMELLWVAARVEPKLKACLEKEFGTAIDETLPVGAAVDPSKRHTGPGPKPLVDTGEAAGPRAEIKTPDQTHAEEAPPGTQAGTGNQG